jgi:hypothetical protein
MTGDQHVGSTLGLCPDEGVRLDEGGRYLPNKAQLWLWDKWVTYWDRVAETVRLHNALLYCLFNGDARDTVGPGHHGNVQLISANQEVQEYVTHRVFGVPRALKPARNYVMRGTEVHVGPSGSSEESLARWLGAMRDPETESWSSWYRRISIYGRVIDATHHTTMGNTPWTEQNAANSLAAKVAMEYTKRRETPPDLVIRSHVHRTADSHDALPTRAIILPCWQLSTSYGYRVNANRLPDVGGAITIIAPDGEMESKVHKYMPDPPPIEIAA